MSDVIASVSRIVDAPPERVYQVLADYAGQHHRILPEEFSGYRVLEGGLGAGTVVEFTVTLAGGARHSRADVTEPEPGRVLVETDHTTSTVTRFTVDREAGGSRVTIDTRFPASPPPRGWAERLFAPRMLRQLYVKELANLSAYVAGD